MCGIFSLSLPAGAVSDDSIARALDALRHRGPDGAGVWRAPDQRTVLAHRRLSISDLAGGGQPLHSEDAMIHLVINGELYGHARLRADLAKRGHRFATQSDSEIALHLYEEYGEDFIHHLRGEFALVLYDENTDTLIAARDRFGIKPLCYTLDGDGRLCIASEAKAIFAANAAQPAWDTTAFYHACTLQYIPAERSVFSGIRQLPPGHMLRLTRGTVTLRKYWDIGTAADKDSTVSDAAWTERFAAALHDSVAVRLCADVPVCAHLSGGIDSSSIAAIAAQGENRIRDCFTVRFPGNADYDEAAIAQEMAAHAGLTLHSVSIDGDSVADHLSDAVYYSEGLAINSHLVGKYLLNRAISRAGYKVALSGEGADELLAGYPHLREDMIDSDGGNDPARLALYADNQKLAGVFLAEGDMLPTTGMTARLGYTPSFLRAKATLGFRLHGLLRDDYRHAMRVHDPFAEMAAHYAPDIADLSRMDGASHLWVKSALATYILRTLGDGCEMAHGVEGRVPFLDHHVWEMARTMPTNLKIRETMEKHILREALRPLLTPTLYRRRKHPFIAPPLARMMTPRLTHMIADTLSSSAFSHQPFFDPAKVAAWLARLDAAAPQEQVSSEPVLMTLLTATALQERYRLAA